MVSIEASIPMSMPRSISVSMPRSMPMPMPGSTPMSIGGLACMSIGASTGIPDLYLVRALALASYGEEDREGVGTGILEDRVTGSGLGGDAQLVLPGDEGGEL